MDLFSISAFFIPFIVYVLTLAPTITYGDNPELIASAFCLGVPHSPGYPLFCLLGKLFSLVIPFGTIAYRINLMSAVFGAAAVFVVYLIIHRLINNKFVSLAAALSLAFSQIFWLYSIQAEVFALNNFLLALVIYFTLQKNWKMSLFFLGIGLANQQNIVLIVPALFYFYLKEEKQKNFKKIFFLLTLIIPGLLIYLYLPISAFFNPPINVGNPVTLSNFFTVITRGYYQRGNFFVLMRNLIVSIPLWPVYLFYYFNSISNNFSFLCFFLTLFGFLVVFKNNKKIFNFLLIAWFFLGPVMIFANYGKLSGFYWHITERLVLGASLILAIWLGYSLNFLQKFLNRKLKILLFFVPIIVFFFNLKKCNFSNYYYGFDLGKNILRSLEQNSIIFSYTDDPFFHLQYFKVVENLRPDVTLLFRTPIKVCAELYQKNLKTVIFSDSVENKKNFSSLKNGWSNEEDFFVKILLNNYKKRPIYSTDPFLLVRKNLLPLGITVKIMDDQQMQKILNNSYQKEKFLKYEETVILNYKKRGNYFLENLPSYTNNLIQVYELATQFKKQFYQNQL